MNRVCLVGHIATDPELKYTPAGVAVASFRIAVRDPYRKMETGQPAADFFDVTVWRERAEYAGNYLTKGTLISLQGRLSINEWVGQDGNKRRTYYITGDQIESLARPRSQDGATTSAPPSMAREEEAEYHSDPFAEE